MKIIKITPVVPVFSIDWIIGTRCNFACSYCPPNLHNKDFKDHDLDTLKSAWTTVFDKSKHRLVEEGYKYQINFTGGEVSINKDFLPFIVWLDENYGQYIEQKGMTTNGSASENFYTSAIQVLDYISFSTHSEFFKEDKFINNVLVTDKLSKSLNKSVHVNIMNEPWNAEKIEYYKSLFVENDIAHSINEINWSHVNR